jgi:hypothetical protein
LRAKCPTESGLSLAWIAEPGPGRSDRGVELLLEQGSREQLGHVGRDADAALVELQKLNPNESTASGGETPTGSTVPCVGLRQRSI